jgi:segregation and condensation protein B
MLFAADAPMTAEALARHLAAAGFGDVSPGAVRQGLRALADAMAGRGVVLVERGGRWHLETAADLAHILRPVHEAPRRLSRAATECLAVIAYHEPVSRAEIEAIRGVQTAKGTLDVLIEAGWVRIAGRREVPGRPVIYATTPGFLAHFGLGSRRDLPGIEELRAAGLLEPMDGEPDGEDAGADASAAVKDGRDRPDGGQAPSAGLAMGGESA